MTADPGLWVRPPKVAHPHVPGSSARSATALPGETIRRDEAMLVAGVRADRRIAEQDPMRSWLVREPFPGPDVQSTEDLSAVLRAAHQSVYHVGGTCRMGAVEDVDAPPPTRWSR